MGFAPMFFRLNQGYTEININGQPLHYSRSSISAYYQLMLMTAGFWETLTYGLLGLYKSDWTASGGFDTLRYTTKWGGEDWDAVDK